MKIEKNQETSAGVERTQLVLYWERDQNVHLSQLLLPRSLSLSLVPSEKVRATFVGGGSCVVVEEGMTDGFCTEIGGGCVIGWGFGVAAIVSVEAA